MPSHSHPGDNATELPSGSNPPAEIVLGNTISSLPAETEDCPRCSRNEVVAFRFGLHCSACGWFGHP